MRAHIRHCCADGRFVAPLDGDAQLHTLILHAPECTDATCFRDCFGSLVRLETIGEPCA
jgi:hypothetical protein